MPRTIYAADDDPDIREILWNFLTNAGYEVFLFPTGDDLLSAFQKRPCDLVLLDIMMPGTDGLSICRHLRKESDVPIIILTAKEGEVDHIRGFLLGGDDYIVKPFSPSLLVVRINALFRRVKGTGFLEDSILYGDICFSDSRHSVTCQGKEIPLTRTEFTFLRCLIQEPGAAVSREQLLNKVWGIETEDIETRVTDETVRRVRYKLKTAGSKVRISAVWGFGYKLENSDEESKK